LYTLVRLKLSYLAGQDGTSLRMDTYRLIVFQQGSVQLHLGEGNGGGTRRWLEKLFICVEMRLDSMVVPVGSSGLEECEGKGGSCKVGGTR
jgi:hypothetical protein